MTNSVYIHIPFCNDICSYCDFCKMYYNNSLIDKYLDELEREVTNYYQGEIISTLYIGGGTPSCLNINQLKKLFSIINKFKFDNNIEFSFECNFTSTTEEKLILLKKNGVNRLSFGIETVSNKLQKILERVNDKEGIRNKIRFARSIGFSNINVDLMYAIPTENLKDLERDIDFVLSLDVEHISTYSLIIEEHTKLKINNFKYIDDELDSKMYYLIDKKLNDYGYEHYEISNYAKKGYKSRHNLVYWNNITYYGFGLGAAGYIDNVRYSNTRSISKYLKGEYKSIEEIVDDRSQLLYEIILNLRLKDGISLSKIKNKYGLFLFDVYKIDDLINEGLLVQNGDNIYIPLKKWYIMNSILVRIMECEENAR